MDSRSTHVYMARMAEQAERYEDMAEAVKAMVESGQPLDEGERSLLSVAFKNISYRRRRAIAALRYVSNVIQWTPLNKPTSGQLNLGLISGWAY